MTEVPSIIRAGKEVLSTVVGQTTTGKPLTIGDLFCERSGLTHKQAINVILTAVMVYNLEMEIDRRILANEFLFPAKPPRIGLLRRIWRGMKTLLS